MQVEASPEEVAYAQLQHAYAELQNRHNEIAARNHELETAAATSSTQSLPVHGPSLSSPLGMKPPKAQLFHGDDTPSEQGLKAQMWVRSLENYFKLNNMPLVDSRVVGYAASCLRDKAERWWFVEEHSGCAPTTWTEFKDSFLSRFVNPNDQVYVVNKFLQLQQKGRLADYAAMFDLYLMQLNLDPSRDPTKEALNTIISCIFVNGLKPELRDRVIDAGYQQQYATARKLAQDHDANQTLAKTGRRSYGPISNSTASSSSSNSRVTYAAKASSDSTRGPAPMEMGAMNITRHPNEQAGRDRPALPRANISKAEEDRRRKEGLCMFCGSKEHRASTCEVRLEQARKGRRA